MILENRNLKPFIHFGFNKTTVTAYAGAVVNVYLNTLYNSNIYDDIELIDSGGEDVIKLNDYHYQIIYSAVGLKTLNVRVLNVDKTINLTSNYLKFNIVSNGFDSDIITFDNTNLTFDNI